jgi:hypothetical protein
MKGYMNMKLKHYVASLPHPIYALKNGVNHHTMPTMHPLSQPKSWQELPKIFILILSCLHDFGV